MEGGGGIYFPCFGGGDGGYIRNFTKCQESCQRGGLQNAVISLRKDICCSVQVIVKRGDRSWRFNRILIMLQAS